MTEPQSKKRLWWVATYHDGTTLDERTAVPQPCSEHIDRENLAQFELVDEDGVAHLTIPFPKGDEPKLVYRRRSFPGRPALNDDGEHLADLEGYPDWLTWEWTYIVGQHFRDGRVEMLGMDADGNFAPVQTDVELVPAELFEDAAA